MYLHDNSTGEDRYSALKKMPGTDVLSTQDITSLEHNWHVVLLNHEEL